MLGSHATVPIVLAWIDESRLTSLTESLNNTKISSFGAQTGPTTHPTTKSATYVAEVPPNDAADGNPAVEDEVYENVWATPIDPVKAAYEALLERAKCPVHGELQSKLCNPSMCQEMSAHLRREKITWAMLKPPQYGPSNIHTLNVLGMCWLSFVAVFSSLYHTFSTFIECSADVVHLFVPHVERQKMEAEGNNKHRNRNQNSNKRPNEASNQW